MWKILTAARQGLVTVLFNNGERISCIVFTRRYNWNNHVIKSLVKLPDTPVLPSIEGFNFKVRIKYHYYEMQEISLPGIILETLMSTFYLFFMLLSRIH